MMYRILWIICGVVYSLQVFGQQSNAIAIIPQPIKQQIGSGYFRIAANTKIQYLNPDAYTQKNTLLYAQFIIPSISTSQVLIDGPPVKTNVILLELTNNNSIPVEGYILKVEKDKIRIQATHAKGLFYGMQSLVQLCNQTNSVVPVVYIQDAPKFEWRGMHLDVSRHFYSIDYLKKFIDLLAYYKINTFHFHITDDQGWRLEIKKYPKLTEMGAFRKFNDQDSVCMRMAKDNPDFLLPKEFLKQENDETLYGGFYTQEQIKDLIKYASARMVTIVPEVDMPGHMMAAIQAYNGLTCVTESGWGKIFSTPLCSCKEEVYTFVENVLSEIADLFPSQYIHIGGDEVDMTSWKKSAFCRELMEKEGIKTAAELQGYFVRRVERFLKSKGKSMIGWDEVLEGGVNPTTAIMYWRGWEKGMPKKATSNGHKVIMTPTDYSYFDYAQDENTLKNLYNSTIIPDNLSPAEAKNIWGVQGNIWTEYIPSIARLEYMVFPRLLAMAEMGWTHKRNYQSFTERMQFQYQWLEKQGVNFRMPTIGGVQEHTVFTDSAILSLEIPLIIKQVMYTVDGSNPSSASLKYTQPLIINDTKQIKIAGFTTAGRMGDVLTLNYEKQTYLPSDVPLSTAKSGLTAGYFEGAIKNLTSLTELQPIRYYKLKDLTVPEDHGKDAFGLVYEGYIHVPEKKIYTFYLMSDDGANLQIGDRTVVENDGPHGPKERSGQIALDKGLHKFRLPFFEAGGGFALKLEWESVDRSREKVPSTAFYSVEKQR